MDAFRRPALVKRLISNATAAQIPSEVKIASAFNSLSNCMCNINLTKAKDVLYPKLSYVFTGAANPYLDTLSMISNLTYSDVSKTFCTLSDCSSFIGRFVKLFTQAAELALATPGAILSGQFYAGFGIDRNTLLATDPPLVSPGTLSSAQMDAFFDSMMPCMCHHMDPASGARDMITWAANLGRNASLFQGMRSYAQGLQPFIKQAMQGSKYCGAKSCRKMVKVLKDHVSSMQSIPEKAGTCTAANAAKCRGGGYGTACSTPTFGPKASQKFPLRWLDVKTMSSNPAEGALTLNDTFLYWEFCSAVAECPVDAPDYFEIKISFTIDVTVETFDKAAFKINLAKFLNKDAADAAGSVMPNDIELKVTAGSLKVEATIKAYTETAKGAVVKSLNAATVDSLSSALGVKVLSKTSAESAAVTTADGQSTSRGLSVGPIIGIVVGAVGAVCLIVGGVAFVMIKKKKKNAPKVVVMVEATSKTVVATTANDDGEDKL